MTSDNRQRGSLNEPHVVKSGGRFYVSGNRPYYLFGPDSKKACEKWVAESAETRRMLAEADAREAELSAQRAERQRREPNHEDELIEFVRLGMRISLEFEIHVDKAETFAGCLSHMAYGDMKPPHALGLLLPFFHLSCHVNVGRQSDPYVEMMFREEYQHLCPDLVTAARESHADMIAYRTRAMPYGKWTYLHRFERIPDGAEANMVRMVWDG